MIVMLNKAFLYLNKKLVLDCVQLGRYFRSCRGPYQHPLDGGGWGGGGVGYSQKNLVGRPLTDVASQVNLTIIFEGLLLLAFSMMMEKSLLLIRHTQFKRVKTVP